MTKDNWIKVFDEILSDCSEEIGVGPKKEAKLKSLLSQVEKDAIEKTNKRWRERIEKQRLQMLVSEEMGNAVFRDLSKKQNELTNAIFDSLSDLLEDKK